MTTDPATESRTGERRATIVRYTAGLTAATIAVATFVFPCFTCEPYLLGLSRYWIFIIALFIVTAVAVIVVREPKSGVETTMSLAYASANFIYFGYAMTAQKQSDSLFSFLIINVVIAGLVIIIGRKVGRLFVTLIVDAGNTKELPL